MRSTASTALFVCVLAALCASLADCTTQPKNVAHRLSTAIHKRQEVFTCSNETLMELIRSFPQECIQVLGNVSDCGRECLALVCSDSCAQPFYDFFVECFEPIIASAWDLLCSTNEDGTLCYDTVSSLLEDTFAELVDACSNFTSISCSTACMEELEKTNKETGCCLYTFIALSTSKKETDEVWASCDVDTPGVCTSKFTGDPIIDPGNGEPAMKIYISVLVAALLMASISLN